MPALLALIPASAYRWLAIGAALLAAIAFVWFNGRSHGEATVQARWDASIAAQQAAAAKLAQQQAVQSAQVEVRYVHDVEKVDVPVVKIRDRLVQSVCPGADGVQHNSTSGLPVSASDSAKPADAAAASDASAGLADDLAAAERNQQQLEDLQALIRANSAAP